MNPKGLKFWILSAITYPIQAKIMPFFFRSAVSTTIYSGSSLVFVFFNMLLRAWNFYWKYFFLSRIGKIRNWNFWWACFSFSMCLHKLLQYFVSTSKKKYIYIFFWYFKLMPRLVELGFPTFFYRKRVSLYSRFRIISSPPKIFSTFKTRKSVGPNPMYLLEVRQYWINSHTVLNRSAHNIPVPNLFPVVLISA